MNSHIDAAAKMGDTSKPVEVIMRLDQAVKAGFDIEQLETVPPMDALIMIGPAGQTRTDYRFVEAR